MDNLELEILEILELFNLKLLFLLLFIYDDYFELFKLFLDMIDLFLSSIIDPSFYWILKGLNTLGNFLWVTSGGLKYSYLSFLVLF